jgi:hypothetical protein
VWFGEVEASDFRVDSDAQITVTAPAGEPGTVDVIVVGPYGTSESSEDDEYTYVAAPTVAELDVTTGSHAGGTTVTITGTNFTGLLTVYFGDTPAAAITVDSSTHITALAPAHPAGVADIAQAVTSYGESLIFSRAEVPWRAS